MWQIISDAAVAMARGTSGNNTTPHYLRYQVMHPFLGALPEQINALPSDLGLFVS